MYEQHRLLLLVCAVHVLACDLYRRWQPLLLICRDLHTKRRFTAFIDLSPERSVKDIIMFKPFVINDNNNNNNTNRNSKWVIAAFDRGYMFIK